MMIMIIIPVYCAVGTYYSTDTCKPCPLGSYQDEEGRGQCKPCPAVNGKPSITPTEGAFTSSHCKGVCDPGHHYSLTTGQCQPCGFGLYQPQSGQSTCVPCPIASTTTTTSATSQDECVADCISGQQLTTDVGRCEECPLGTYRTGGVHERCQPCPAHRPTTAATGTIREADCIASPSPDPTCPCLNGGQCTSAGLCRCPTHYSGSKCEIDTAPPTSPTLGGICPQGCANGGTCALHPDTRLWSCECTTGFDGEGCQVQTGSSSTGCTLQCENGGECIENEKEQYCVCEAGYDGVLCEQEADVFTNNDLIKIAGGVAGAFALLLIVALIIVFCCCCKETDHSGKGSTGLLPPGMISHAGSIAAHSNPALAMMPLHHEHDTLSTHQSIYAHSSALSTKSGQRFHPAGVYAPNCPCCIGKSPATSIHNLVERDPAYDIYHTIPLSIPQGCDQRMMGLASDLEDECTCGKDHHHHHGKRK